MTWIISILGRYLWPAAAIACAALLLALGVQTHRVKTAQAETAEVTKAWQLDRAQATSAALKASTEYRALEAQMQAQSQKAERDYHAALTRNDSALAASRADNDRMRGQLAAYASGGGQASVDTVAACRGRAETLGLLLGTSMREADESAAELESSADAVRALLSAWPR